MIISSPTEEQNILNQIEGISFLPIFILGDQRSGTTLLYKLLASTSMFNYVSAYDVIEYQNLLLNSLNSLEETKRSNIDSYLKSKNVKNRGFDSVKVNSLLPEEYGFILRNNSKNSKTCKENKDILIEACRKIQYIKNKKKPILLKNPNDFSNMGYLSQLFENAKFIVILRNENDIAKSKRNAAIHLFKEYNHYTGMLSNEYKEYYGSLFWRILIKLYYSRLNIFLKSIFLNEIKKYRNEFRNSVDGIDQCKYIIIHYEDLCNDTNITISSILNFLDINVDDKISFSEEIYRR